MYSVFIKGAKNVNVNFRIVNIDELKRAIDQAERALKEIEEWKPKVEMKEVRRVPKVD